MTVNLMNEIVIPFDLTELIRQLLNLFQLTKKHNYLFHMAKYPFSTDNVVRDLADKNSIRKQRSHKYPK